MYAPAMESETLFDQERLQGRRRFLKAAAAVLLCNEAARIGLHELLIPKTQAPEFSAPRTLNELGYVIWRELSARIHDIPKPQADPQGTGAGSFIDLPAMIGNGFQHVKDTGITNIPGAASDFLTRYGEGDLTDPSYVRCNNHAYDACRKFARYGMPMHLVALAPPIRHFCSFDWHVMAFCPLQGNQDNTQGTLVFSNGTPLLWRHGGLNAFAAWHEQALPPEKRRWIPWRGIARFHEPEHPITHRLLMHIGHAVVEKDVEALTIDSLMPEKMPMLA